MKILSILAILLVGISCSKKEVVACAECPRCPDQIVCATPQEIVAPMLKDWVKLGDHEIKCMQRVPK